MHLMPGLLFVCCMCFKLHDQFCSVRDVEMHVQVLPSSSSPHVMELFLT